MCEGVKEERRKETDTERRRKGRKTVNLGTDTKKTDE